MPLAIHNNKGGADKEVLEHYEEPAWNNPVVRFFGSDGRELIARKDRVWTGHEHAARMIAALEKAGDPVPAYLLLAREELTPARLESAVFSMACYWKGEAFFGGLEGVRSTSAGWLEGQEVVEVLYDPKVIDLSKLVGEASAKSCANQVWVGAESQLPVARQVAGEGVKVHAGSPRDAKTSDRKFHLRRSSLNLLDLTPLQATRINSDLEARRDARRWLSKRQAALLGKLEALLKRNPEALDGLERPAKLDQLAAYRQRLVLCIRAAR